MNNVTFNPYSLFIKCILFW